MLEDGTYDVFVVDAEPHAGADGGDAVTLELTVLAGPHKGEVLSIHASGTGRDPLDLLGAPGTLTVRDGEPSVRLEG